MERSMGWVHWPTIRAQHFSEGLVRSSLSFALHKLAGWHERCYVRVPPGRLPDVRLLLEFGFEP